MALRIQHTVIFSGIHKCLLRGHKWLRESSFFKANIGLPWSHGATSPFQDSLRAFTEPCENILLKYSATCSGEKRVTVGLKHRDWKLFPRKLTWNLIVTPLKRRLIFQTFIFVGIHVNFRGYYNTPGWNCTLNSLKMLPGWQRWGPYVKHCKSPFQLYRKTSSIILFKPGNVGRHFINEWCLSVLKAGCTCNITLRSFAKCFLSESLRQRVCNFSYYTKNANKRPT